MRRMSRVVFLLLFVLMPGVAWAHPHLTKSDPADKARLTTAPTAIRLWFSETPDVSKTTLMIHDAAGKVVPTAPTRAGTGARNVRVPIRVALKPGRYAVVWTAHGLNGHMTTGSFEFTVLDR